MRNAPYTGLETWELDGCLTAFNAEQVGQTHLGYFFENRLIQLSLWQQIDQMDNITLLCPHSVTQFERLSDRHQVSITIDNGETLTTKIIDRCRWR